jgi:hypothetical protein
MALPEFGGVSGAKQRRGGNTQQTVPRETQSKTGIIPIIRSPVNISNI